MNGLLINAFEEMSEDSLLLECAYQAHMIDLADADFMLEMVEFKEKQNIERSKLKVYSENGTDDDLQALYEQVFLESEETKKGVFTKIWEAIKGIFKSIRESISKLFGKKDDKIDKIAVDKNQWEATKKSTSKISGALKLIAKILAAVGVAGGVAVGGKVIHDKLTNPKTPVVIEQMDNCKQDIENVKKQLESVKVSGALPDKNIIYVAPSEFDAVSKEIDDLAKEGEELAAKAMKKSEDASPEEMKVVKPLADTLRGVADASKSMTQAQLNARANTEKLFKAGQDKQTAADLSRKPGEANKVNAKLDADDNRYDYEQIYGGAKKTANASLDEKDYERMQKEQRNTSRATVINSSAEDDTEGEPAFEAGSLDDIMALIADL